MEHPKILHDGITFDDVLLIPARSDFVPSEADTHTKLTRGITVATYRAAVAGVNTIALHGDASDVSLTG